MLSNWEGAVGNERRRDCLLVRGSSIFVSCKYCFHVFQATRVDCTFLVFFSRFHLYIGLAYGRSG